VATPVRPQVLVDIELFSSDRGGRQGAILQGEYRGVLSVGKESFSVRFLVSSPKGFAPGESARVGVQFLAPEAALPHFPIGRAFEVWEGGVVGGGTVVAMAGNA